MLQRATSEAIEAYLMLKLAGLLEECQEAEEQQRYRRRFAEQARIHKYFVGVDKLEIDTERVDMARVHSAVQQLSMLTRSGRKPLAKLHCLRNFHQ